MKTIVYEDIKDVKVRNVGDPGIKKDDDIILKVTSTAICGSDLHLIHGMVPNMPKSITRLRLSTSTSMTIQGSI